MKLLLGQSGSPLRLSTPRTLRDRCVSVGVRLEEAKDQEDEDQEGQGGNLQETRISHLLRHPVQIVVRAVKSFDVVTVTRMET